MEVVYVGLVLALFFFFKYLKERQDKKNQEDVHADDADARLHEQAVASMHEKQEKEDTKTLMENNKGTRDLFLETLAKIGCQYEFADEEGDDRIFFAYQGEHFFVNATNEGWYIHIYDTHWGHVELYDIEEFARLKKAINGSNLNNSVMTVYTIDEAGSNVDVHCKSTILFVPQIPRIEDYLRLELNEFFRAHRYVGNEMEKLRASEKSY